MKRILNALKNFIKAMLDELYLIENEGLFLRQFKNKGGSKRDN